MKRCDANANLMFQDPKMVAKMLIKNINIETVSSQFGRRSSKKIILSCVTGLSHGSGLVNRSPIWNLRELLLQ